MAGTEVVLPAGDAATRDTIFGGRPLHLLGLDGQSEGDLAILDHASGTLIASDLAFHNRAAVSDQSLRAQSPISR